MLWECRLRLEHYVAVYRIEERKAGIDCSRKIYAE